MPTTLVLRDYHVDNLMVLPGRRELGLLADAIEKEIEEVRLLCCPGCVFGLIRQPLSFLTILPVRKRQSSLTNVILRPYYAVYLLE